MPDDLERRVEGLGIVCSSDRAEITRTREDRLRDMADESSAEEFVNVHPVVRTHPETREKILYVNEDHAVRFDGWTEEASEPLLQELYKHQRKPELQINCWADENNKAGLRDEISTGKYYNKA